MPHKSNISTTPPKTVASTSETSTYSYAVIGTHLSSDASGKKRQATKSLPSSSTANKQQKTQPAINLKFVDNFIQHAIKTYESKYGAISKETNITQPLHLDLTRFKEKLPQLIAITSKIASLQHKELPAQELTTGQFIVSIAPDDLYALKIGTNPQEPLGKRMVNPAIIDKTTLLNDFISEISQVNTAKATIRLIEQLQNILSLSSSAQPQPINTHDPNYQLRLALEKLATPTRALLLDQLHSLQEPGLKTNALIQLVEQSLKQISSISNTTETSQTTSKSMSISSLLSEERAILQTAPKPTKFDWMQFKDVLGLGLQSDTTNPTPTTQPIPGTPKAPINIL